MQLDAVLATDNAEELAPPGLGLVAVARFAAVVALDVVVVDDVSMHAAGPDAAAAVAAVVFAAFDAARVQLAPSDSAAAKKAEIVHLETYPFVALASAETVAGVELLYDWQGLRDLAIAFVKTELLRPAQLEPTQKT